ncbi:ABC transporter permease [Photobacterium damselae]|uniref:Transport permease protein n=1 Tax=Photobacterium damselae TaxID=38293 RepID=A0ABD6WYC2_PHODM|nr:ABC transporter permease [Photobacterium damselae]OBU42445.1 ABC transporter permease [Photobacterium damselae]PSU14137.1 ABC transporter permease [Photobacterium damselae]
MNIKLLAAHKQLFVQMVKREIASRYRGSSLGMFWSILNPLLMLSVYTFVFSIVFKAKWGGGDGETESSFAVILFAGLMIHGFLAEVLLLSPNSISGNSNYVKKVIFPIEILNLVNVSAALFNLFISVVVLIAIAIITGTKIHYTIIYAPLVLAPLVVLSIGVGWLVSSLGVYLKDINQLMGVITSVLLFISPVFFSLDNIPAEFKQMVFFNPLTIIIEQFRGAVLWGRIPDFYQLTIYTLIAITFTVISFFIFSKLKKGFSDVL